MVQQIKTSKPVLDKYKDTLQPMVDEALAVQNLAPAVKDAIAQNKPLNEGIQDVTTEAIERNPKTRDALDTWYANSKAIRNSKSELRKPSYCFNRTYRYSRHYSVYNLTHEWYKAILTIAPMFATMVT